MNAYKQIKSIAIGEEVTQIFLVASVEGRTTKTGKPYARVTLKDKTGQITANLWDFDANDYQDFVSGSYARMTIQIEDYNGSRQAKSRAMPMVLAPPDDLNDYESDLKLSKVQSKLYYDSLMEHKNSVENIYLKAYLNVIFDNETTAESFQIAPASVSNRGAYRGGLVEHTHKVMCNAIGIMNAQSTAKDPAKIDREMVIVGVLCHDLGKMYAYRVSATGVHHTRSGLLLAHLPMSYGISVKAFAEAESVLRREIPEDIQDHVNHCILAHHGVLEYGSPIKPQSIEAQIIHVADMADSTTSCFAELTRDNIDHVDENGFVAGSFFASRTVYVGSKGEDE